MSLEFSSLFFFFIQNTSKVQSVFPQILSPPVSKISATNHPHLLCYEETGKGEKRTAKR